MLATALLDWRRIAGLAAMPKSRGMHHYAVLGITDANGAYHEYGCRFASLCALLRGNA